MKKKLLALFLALVMVGAVLPGCGDGSKDPGGQGNNGKTGEPVKGGEITGTGDLRSLPAFREGRFLVQDAAARLAAMAASAAPGDRVLDVCAAPGGKSFSMAMDMGDRGQILSCDVHPYKVKLIESGAQRLGLTCIRAATADAREKHAAWASSPISTAPSSSSC